MKLHALQYKEGSDLFGPVVLISEKQMKTWGTQNYDYLGTVEVTEPGKQSLDELKAEALRISKRICDMIMTGAPLPFPEPPKPKQGVTKAITWDDAIVMRRYSRDEETDIVEVIVPSKTKTVKCIYEVEE